MKSKQNQDAKEKPVCDIVVELKERFDNKDVVKHSGSWKNIENANEAMNPSGEKLSSTSITIADIIGEFGFYQLSITLITFIRYLCVALMTNSGPLIAPAVEFSCLIPDELENFISEHKNEYSSDDQQCILKLINGTNFNCTSWTYNKTEFGETLTDNFDLVCGRKILRSVFQVVVTLGVSFSSVFWGYFSDKYGRKVAIRVTFICSLISGIVSYYATSFTIYTLSRAVCSFSDLGLVVSLATTTVELLGNKYRGAVCIIVYTGWAFGVWASAWLTEYFRDYQQLMLVTIIIHLMTLPWLITIHESVRWLLVNGKIDEANGELRRISWWNCKGDEESLAVVNKKFDLYKVKYIAIIEKKRKQDNDLTNSLTKKPYKVAQLFQSRELAINTITLIWTTFNCEFLYMFFILVNSDIGGDTKLNYTIGCFMEVLATIISIVIIKKVTRRLSLVSTLVIISASCCALAFTHHDLLGVIGIMNFTKLAVSTLSSIIYVTSAEMFPTDLRQTGFGLSNTLGSLGGAIAPLVRDQIDVIGMTKVLLSIVTLPLTAAIVIPFYLRETSNVDISDVVDDIENETTDFKLARSASVSSKQRRPSISSVLKI